MRCLFNRLARLPVPELPDNLIDAVFSGDYDVFELYAINFGLADGSVLALVTRDGIWQSANVVKNVVKERLGNKIRRW